MTAMMERVRAKYGLPSICAGAILDGKVVALDAIGVRKLGGTDKATKDDLYHCGSNTKSFTAALFATFVQEGRVRWSSTLPELFPALAKTMDPAFRKVTALDLMAHRSGLNGDSWPEEGEAALRAWNGQGPSPRLDYARRFLSLPPDHSPGSRFEYSNANYVILGAAVEILTGKTWETLLKERLLQPLCLTSAGFGAAGTAGKTDQPWGHYEQDGKLLPVEPGPGADNPPALGPAGTLHMSVADMLKWCAFQADEGRHGGPLIPESFRTLHTAPFGGDYAGGVVVLPRDWAGGNALYHRGSNTMSEECFWIAPTKRFAVVVATNASTPNAPQATDEIVGELIMRYCPK